VLSYGEAPGRVGINRREWRPDRGVVIGSNPGGLVDEVVPTVDALDAALSKWFKYLEPGSPHAIERAKRALLHRDEISEFARCFTSPEAKEGITAFLEKRKAAWVRS